MDVDIESLERATLDAVAPAEVGVLPGWLLPFDPSSVGRATSAVPLRHAKMDPRALGDIEARYARRGLRAQFRIAEQPGLAQLHRALLGLGYSAEQATLTMVGAVGRWPAIGPGWQVHITPQPTPQWRSVYLAADFDPVDAAHRVRLLSRSPHLVFASLSDASGAIAAGTASFSQGWASLHGMRTLAKERGRGCASALIAALAQVARAKGMERCFLQVDASNTAATSLYRRLGFETAWQYHYWRKLA